MQQACTCVHLFYDTEGIIGDGSTLTRMHVPHPVCQVQ
jgi:hypothetical protein